MWILSFIPDLWLRWFIHSIVVLGLLLTFGGSILSFIPFIKSYGRITRGLGILLIIAGIFFEGGYVTEMSWRHRVEEMEAKVAESEAKANEANKNLSLALVTRSQEIKASQVLIQQQLTKITGVIDAQCKVHPDAISLLNQAAKRPGDKK